MSNNSSFIRVEEIAKELDVSKPCAYKLMRKLNEELKRKNYITVSGRLSRKYFQERIYGLRTEKERPAIKSQEVKRNNFSGIKENILIEYHADHYRKVLYSPQQHQYILKNGKMQVFPLKNRRIYKFSA